MRILVVEDNQKLALLIKKGLEKESYVADCIFDGESAQQRVLVGDSEYDLVILDIMLPKKDGVSVCKTWREAGIGIPVIMLTAKDTTQDKIHGLDSGADDYLVKPFSFTELLARIRALLRRPKLITGIELKAGDIKLMPSSRKVFVGKKEVVVTQKEFMILEYMMVHQNQILTREDLFEHAWDFAANTLSNTIDVHIKNLRRKIDKISKKQHIETIRGVGYKFNE